MITRSSASEAVASAVDRLPCVGLAEVTEQASLRTRDERKYLVPVGRFAELIGRLPPRYAVLEIGDKRGFAYESVYFDTPDLLTYRQHLQGRRRRFKVRTRAYLDSAACVFELKLKGSRDQTIKARLPYRVADRKRITPLAQSFLDSELKQTYGQSVPHMAAMLTTAYRRTTLVDLEREARLTCDVDLICTGNDRTVRGLAKYVLVESKSVGARNDADVALHRLGLRSVQLSKYCVAVALLDPAIRSNPWHRTLRRYFS